MGYLYPSLLVTGRRIGEWKAGREGRGKERGSERANCLRPAVRNGILLYEISSPVINSYCINRPSTPLDPRSSGLRIVLLDIG